MKKVTIPESIKQEVNDYIIPKNIKRIGIMSDIHFPFHNKAAIEIAIQYLKEKKIDCLVLNGDILDAFDFSDWHRNPKKIFIQDEMYMGREFVKYIKQEFGDILILWKRGNHELRIKTFMEKKCHILLDIPEFDFPYWFKFKENGIIDVHDKAFIHFGKLIIAHGHELGKQIFEPANIARSVSIKTNEIIIIGHWHRTSEHVEPSSIRKVVRSAWSTGCLCDLQPEYARSNKWNHGFAYAERVGDEGDFMLENKKILLQQGSSNKRTKINSPKA